MCIERAPIPAVRDPLVQFACWIYFSKTLHFFGNEVRIFLYTYRLERVNMCTWSVMSQRNDNHQLQRDSARPLSALVPGKWAMTDSFRVHFCAIYICNDSLRQDKNTKLIFEWEHYSCRCLCNKNQVDGCEWRTRNPGQPFEPSLATVHYRFTFEITLWFRLCVCEWMSVCAFEACLAYA